MTVHSVEEGPEVLVKDLRNYIFKNDSANILTINSMLTKIVDDWRTKRSKSIAHKSSRGRNAMIDCVAFLRRMHSALRLPSAGALVIIV